MKIQKLFFFILIISILIIPSTAFAITCGNQFGECPNNQNCCKSSTGPGFYCQEQPCPTQTAIGAYEAPEGSEYDEPPKTCSTDADCDEGYVCATIDTQTGVKECVSKSDLPSSIQIELEKCTSNADCTKPNQACVNGVCATIYPIQDYLNLGGDPNIFTGRIINYIAGISGSLGLIMFIYGGALWLFSAGNPEMVKKGKNAMIWSAVGITVILSAYILVSWVLGAFGK